MLHVRAEVQLTVDETIEAFALCETYAVGPPYDPLPLQGLSDQ
jgi:hypothetical protein